MYIYYYYYYYYCTYNLVLPPSKESNKILSGVAPTNSCKVDKINEQQDMFRCKQNVI